MDFSISEEQRAFVDTVRKVCQKEFAPRAIRYLDGTWPAENMKRLAEVVNPPEFLTGEMANLSGQAADPFKIPPGTATQHEGGTP